MKGINRAILLDQLEAITERHLADAIRHFQNLDTTILLAPAADGGWSIAQCLEHLNRYGDHYLAEIEKGIARYNGHGTGNPIFNSTWMGRYFTKMMDPETGKRKIKAFKEYKPVRDLDAHAVVAKFIAQQEELLKLLHSSRTVDLNTIRIPVSIARFIRLRLGDVLGFFIAHNERHIRQAKRNLPL
jgi:hypothetical protein